MASEAQVKEYLACWLQLGKQLGLNGGRNTISIQTVIADNSFSRDFEDCWNRLRKNEAGVCYLDGTQVTVEQLLSPRWAIIDCARCSMPIPVPIAGIAPNTCPCHNLDDWPNCELPMPRIPVNSEQMLLILIRKLQQGEEIDASR